MSRTVPGTLASSVSSSADMTAAMAAAAGMPAVSSTSIRPV